MAAPIKKMKRFLEAVEETNKECEVVLYKVLVNGRKEEVWKSQKWSAQLDDTISLIADSAQGTADAGQGGLTKFLLQALDPEDDYRVVATTGFALASTDTGGDEEALSEPATLTGLLGMLMRHNSELHRQSSGTWGVMFQYMTRIIERQSEQLERYEIHKAQSAETMEALISKKHQRDLESRQVEADIKRKDEMFGKIMMLLPVAVNKIMGRELVHQKDTLFEITSAEFIRGVSSEQIEMLVQGGILDKQQMALMITMMEELNKRAMVTAQEKAQQTEKAEKSIFSSIGSAVTNLIDPSNIGK